MASGDFQNMNQQQLANAAQVQQGVFQYGEVYGDVAQSILTAAETAWITRNPSPTLQGVLTGPSMAIQNTTAVREDTGTDYAVACIAYAIDHDRLTPAQKATLRMKLACDLISAAQSYVGGPLTVAEESPGQTEETNVAGAVQKMCDYLKDLKVVPPHVEQLGHAVDKAKRDRAALRAMKGFR